MRIEKKQQLRQRRRWRVRRKVLGTADRPRMSVCFSHRHIHVQFIDDTQGMTLAAVSSVAKSDSDSGARPAPRGAANVQGALHLGKLAAQAALAKGIQQVVFDRGRARYHWSKGKGKDAKPVYGKVAALAVAAREAGLKF